VQWKPQNVLSRAVVDIFVEQAPTKASATIGVCRPDLPTGDGHMPEAEYFGAISQNVKSKIVAKIRVDVRTCRPKLSFLLGNSPVWLTTVGAVLGIPEKRGFHRSRWSRHTFGQKGTHMSS
jgi:hypothetical protein